MANYLHTPNGHHYLRLRIPSGLPQSIPFTRYPEDTPYDRQEDGQAVCCRIASQAPECLRPDPLWLHYR